jgi:hypothetical protein
MLLRCYLPFYNFLMKIFSHLQRLSE